MNVFKKLKAFLQLREAIRMADDAHQKMGGRFYVMPNGAVSGKLLVMDRFNFRKLKQKGYISRKALVNDLLNDCFYYTSDKREVGAMPQKEQKYRRGQYFAWIERCIKVKRLKKKRSC